MRSTLIRLWPCVYTTLLLFLPCTALDSGVRGAAGYDTNHQQKGRRIQEDMMPLPDADDEVEYSPVYNARMKNCPGYEAEGLKGYTSLDDLRNDLQLYFYDTNGYSYHRSPEVIAADKEFDLMEKMPTSQPSMTPSVSSKPSVTASDAPSFSPSKHPITAAPTDEPTSSVRLPVEPTKSPSPTMLPRIVGSPDGEGGLFGTDVVTDGDEDSTFAPTVLVDGLRTAAPTLRPTMEMDENTLDGAGRKRVRGLIADEAVRDRRRLQDVMTTSSTVAASEYYAEVMSEEGLPEIDEVTTAADGEEILIPVTVPPDEESETLPMESKKAIHFHICPDTNFQFDSIYVAELKLFPLVLETPVQKPLTLACLKENTCIFNGGNYHLVFNNNGLEDDSFGESRKYETITVRGINFQEAEEASNVLNDPRGGIIFDECKWESNKAGAITIDGKYSLMSRTRENNLERHFYGVNDYMLPEGRKNPHASTEPTVVATSTLLPDEILFGTTVDSMTTDYSTRERVLEESSTSGAKSTIRIRNSTFTGNKGKAIIDVESFPDREGYDAGASTATGSIHLELEESTFSFERVKTSVIVANGATVSSTRSVFNRNTASSMIETSSGTISITDTEFTNNEVTGGEGVVVVDIDSKVGDTNCRGKPPVGSSGDDTVSILPISDSDSDLCEGAVVAGDGTCRTFGERCNPFATPTFLGSREFSLDSFMLMEGDEPGSSLQVTDGSVMVGVGTMAMDSSEGKSSKSSKSARQSTQKQVSSLGDEDETVMSKSMKNGIVDKSIDGMKAKAKKGDSKRKRRRKRKRGQ